MGQQISACRQVLELNSCRFAVNKLLQVRISECFVNTWVLANMTEQLLQTLRMLATAKPATARHILALGRSYSDAISEPDHVFVYRSCPQARLFRIGVTSNQCAGRDAHLHRTNVMGAVNSAQHLVPAW